MKKVINVVFYKFYGENGEMSQACLFYDDGTVQNVSVEQGIDATHKIAREEKIKTKEELKARFNNDRIYVMSGQEFERRFQEFRVLPKVKKLTPADYKMTQEAWDDYIAQGFEPGTEDFNSAVILDGTGVVPKTETPEPAPVKKLTPADYKMTQEAWDDYIAEGFEPGTDDFNGAVILDGTGVVPPVTPRVVTPIATPAVTPKTVTPRTTTPRTVTPKTVTPVVTITTRTTTPTVTAPIVTPRTTTPTVTTPVVTPTKTTPVIVPVVTPKTVTPTVTPRTVTPTVTPRTTTPTVAAPVVTPTVTPPKKKNIFQRAIDKLKKNKVVKRILIGVTALAIAAGVYSCAAKQTKEGQIVNPPSITSTMLDETSEAYINLLNQTTNETQKEAMTHASYLMDNFNTTFAEAYVEEGKDVKAALTWDEMMALNLAYNDYSKEEIIAMFNGAELDANELSQAYRNGTLQLMGAYVISDSENPVNVHLFLKDEEEQAFVEKYQTMFYACKEAETNEARIAAVNAFYAELYKDFPISDEVREVGISHAEGRAQLDNYKLAVTPMVAAAEMMFQNLDIDHTLSDKAIAYFNDLGLCNLADETIEKAAYISLAADIDETNPSYEEFKQTKIDELTSENSYNIADADRDLSQLDAFQYWVNGGFTVETGKTASHTGGGTTSTQTTTRTETTTTTRTETTTHTTDDRDEAVSQAGEEAVKKAEEAVDQQIAEENEQAKKEGEKAAEEKRQELQDEADEQTKKNEEQVKQNDQDLQDKIDDANKEINNGGTVNEEDFGDHNVDFDDEHSDENGNLDDSVKDITTDGTGAVDSSDPLPDPNLDEDEYSYSYNSSAASTSVDTTTSTQTGAEYGQTSSAAGQVIYSYEEELTNEQLVDEWIKSLEGGTTAEETSSYHK